MYEQLLKVGFTQFKYEKYHNRVTETDVYDIASGVIMRIIEKGEPVIKCAPSAYMKMAMYRSGNKRNRCISLDMIGEDVPVSDDHTIFTDCTIEQALDGLDTDEETKGMVEDILKLRLNFADYKRGLPYNQRRELNRVMEEVKRRVKTCV